MTVHETQQLTIMAKKEFAPAQTQLQSDKTEDKLSEDMKALVRALAVHSIWAQVGLLDKK
ncbi:MAG: hypothetical protein KME19_18890 [Microcoleus vaginatus WJT46-NPBG5]|jgi:hypothetical protein|nr:hypothetical protein [Microcoleus vaginatus WJT46-NPBG5]